MLHDDGVVDRKILRAPLEVTHGITSALHHLTNETVGPIDSWRRIIHEVRLQLPPFVCIAATVVGIQRANIERIYALCPFLQLPFGDAAVADVVYGLLVFRSETAHETLPRLVPEN